MFHDGYHFWGMHLIWWFIWLIILFSIFGFFEPVRKTRIKRDSPLDILQKRFASGEISKDEYFENKKILEEDIKSAGKIGH